MVNIKIFPPKIQKKIALDTINDLEELLEMQKEYGILRFFRRDFWRLIKKNPNRLMW